MSTLTEAELQRKALVMTNRPGLNEIVTAYEAWLLLDAKNKEIALLASMLATSEVARAAAVEATAIAARQLNQQPNPEEAR